MKIVIKIFSLFLLLLLAACATGRTAFDNAQQLERNGKYDEAVIKYAEAVATNPESSEYRLGFLKTSEQAARVHLKAGDELLAAKNLDAAYLEYQKAMVLDPSLDRAKQQLEVLKKFRASQQSYSEGEAFEKENKIKEAVRSYQKSLNFNPANKNSIEALDRLLKTRKAKTEGFELNLKSTKPITLKFKDAKIKDVFNIITQLSGINFVFDDAMKDAPITIYLENATFQQALDIICGMQKLGRKVLNETTIIVYGKSPDKIKQYEDLYVQTFFLNKLDAKKAVNLIRTMLQVKKIYVNEEMNTLVIRDTMDVIEVARRILEANDVPDAEVVLEVEVIELSKRNAESFGLALSRYAIGLRATGPSGQFLSDTFATTNAVTTAGSGLTTGGTAVDAATTITRADTSQLVNLFRWGDYNAYITVPNATFNFGKTLGNAETLSNPKLRVKNREKAKFNVGTRVPITTTSSNGVGNYNVNVQYVDVGVKINAEPTIQLNNDVNIKLSLEVSSILSTARVGTDGNTTVATIGTRNMDTVLSLKDGETSVIGGLIQDTKGQNSQKIFFLGDIPIIGPLLSNHDNTGDKTELILAITPRIVRGITVSDPEIAAFWSGLEDDPSVSRGYASFAQEPEFTQPSAKTVSPAPPQVPQPLTPVKKPDVQQPTPAQVQPTAPVEKPAVPAASAPATIPVPAEPVVTAPTAAAPTAAAPTAAAPTAAAPTAAAPTAAVSPAVVLPAVVPPASPVVAPAVAPAPPPAPQKKVSIRVSAPAVVKQGEQFAAEIMAVDADSLATAPFTVVFDPAFLEVVTVAEGDLFNKDGKAATFTNKIDNQGGQVAVKLVRAVGAGGVVGGGRLLTMNFRAKAPGPASIGFIGVKLQSDSGKQLDAILYNAVVEVRKP